MRGLVRWSGRGLLLVMLATAGVWGYAEGRQWLLRLRAQRLLADVERLRVKDATWDDLQRFRAKWGKWGDYYGVCDPTYCLYSVRLDVSPPLLPSQYDGYSYPKLGRFIQAAGLRSTDLGAAIVVRRGAVVAKAFLMNVYPPLSESQTVLSTLVGEGPSVYHSNDRGRHPNHGLYLTNRQNLIVTFTPDESAIEQAKLMNFRFDCITAIRPCEDRNRLLPEAAAEFNSEPEATRFGQPLTCNTPFWVLARDEQAVVMGDVLSAKLDIDASSIPGLQEWFVTLRLRRVMKGKIVWPAEKPMSITVYDDRVIATKGNVFPFKSLLVAGRPAIVEDIAPLIPEPCSVVEASPENIVQAQLGITKDFSPEPLQER